MDSAFLQQVFLNNTIFDYLIAILILLAGNIIMRLFKFFFRDKIYQAIGNMSEAFSELLVRSLDKKFSFLLNILLIYIAFTRIKFTPFIERIIELVLLVFTLFYSVLIIQELIIYSLKGYWQIKEKKESQEKIINVLIFFVRAFTWILALVFLLDNMKVKITGLLTGLGIGGVAVAFAAQALLSDIFSYFTIYFDQPFEIGDYIVIGDYRGTVEHIGLKTTRVRSLNGEQLVFPNNDLTGSRINNYGKMEQRRVNFSFGVVYNTDLEKLKQIPEVIENIISGIKKTTFDRAHFGSYGDFSLVFEVVYYVQGNDYKVYMDIQQKINFKIREEFKKRDIEFAYPTQTLYLKNNDISIDD